jgi:hypothetical protein
MCILAIQWSGVLFAQSKGTETFHPGQVRIQRAEIPKQPASEFYTTDSKAGILLRVNIWGEVSRPGVYFLPEGSSVADSVSSAGGPSTNAALPDVRLFRDKKDLYLNLITEGGDMPIQESDMIFVDRSTKAELPLILGTISTILSVAAFYFVLRNEKK